MRILFCIDTMTKGGAERVISNLTDYLVKKDYKNDVYILTITNSEVDYKLNEKVDLISLEQKVTLIHDNNSKNINKFMKLKNFYSRVKKMRKKIQDIKPDVIVSFLPYTSFVVLLANNKKIPVIVSVRNDPVVEYSSKMYNFFMKKLYPKASGFVFQKDDAKAYFKDIVNADTAVIPNPINPDFIVSESFKGERKKEIVSVGRLFEQKNHKLLINAFSEIANEYPEYKLVIYGDGSERKKLEELIKNTNMSDRIFLPGIIDNIREKIYDASMFVLSSNYEGMPNALMEAMALGLPVISTDCPCGGPRFLIENNVNGILIDVENKEQLKEAIIKIIKNQQFSKNISEKALEISKILNPNKINKQWEEFILKMN